jgi:hypothetical protein
MERCGKLPETKDADAASLANGHLSNLSIACYMGQGHSNRKLALSPVVHHRPSSSFRHPARLAGLAGVCTFAQGESNTLSR